MHKRFILMLVVLFAVTTLSAQRKQIRAINNNWEFYKGNLRLDKSHSNLDLTLFKDLECETISIPHTWNNLDAIDETPGYYRGLGWYKKVVDFDAEDSKARTLLYFEGANQITELYVNGKWVGKHLGGYTRFHFDITEFLNYGKKNVLVVKVDNSHNEAIPPL